VLVALVVVARSNPEVRERSTDVDVIAAYLNREANPRDLVVVSFWAEGVTLNRYYHGRAPWLSLPPLSDFTVHRADLVLAAMRAPQPMAKPLAAMASTLRSGGRVWIVSKDDTPATAPARFQVPTPLASNGVASMAPYDMGWTLEALAFLAAHATGGQRFPAPFPPGTVNPYEDARLYVAQGWH
jgi:hypothetical protein